MPPKRNQHAIFNLSCRHIASVVAAGAVHALRAAEIGNLVFARSNDHARPARPADEQPGQEMLGPSMVFWPGATEHGAPGLGGLEKLRLDDYKLGHVLGEPLITRIGACLR